LKSKGGGAVILFEGSAARAEMLVAQAFMLATEGGVVRDSRDLETVPLLQ
jgi:hypothetical protein